MARPNAQISPFVLAQGEATAGGGGGGGASVTPRGALVGLAADITTANYSGGVFVPFDLEDYDTDAVHDNSTNNSRLTVPAGVTHVRISFSVSIGLHAADQYVRAFLNKNGVSTIIGLNRSAQEIGSTFAWFNDHSAVMEVVEGDYFEIKVQTEADTSITVEKNGTWFAMEIVAPINRAAHQGAVVNLAADLTAQNLSAGVNLAFDQEEYDDNDFHDLVTNKSRLTVPTGVTRVRISGNVSLSLVSANAQEVLEILKNGAVMDPGIEARLEMAATSPSLLVFTYTVIVVAGDYFELNILCTDTSVTVRAESTWFAIDVVE